MVRPRRGCLPCRQASRGRVFLAHTGYHACVCACPYMLPLLRLRGKPLQWCVWPCCSYWRGREGEARQGPWHGPPAFCMYVSLANSSPFEDSLLMQPGMGSGGAREGATHVLSVCNQWKGLVRSLQLRQGWLLGRSPRPSLILLIVCPLHPASSSLVWPLALTAHTALQYPICPLTSCWEGALNQLGQPWVYWSQLCSLSTV